MKKYLAAICLLGSISAHASTEASLDYSCELSGQVRNGTVSIDDQFVNGEASCMYISGKDLCFRFERHVRIKAVYLALRHGDQLRAGLDDNFIQLGNIPPAEGAVEEIDVKIGFLKTRTLKCTFSNVHWNP
ncbi:MAG: hypothetical protein HYW49_08505 [Deltaproteobacteria bacterium]|nr:hypothetical protein [Deltaproteobacteria bacterium]